MENMALVFYRLLESRKFQKFVKKEGGSSGTKNKRPQEVKSKESILEEISMLKLQDVDFFVRKRSLSNKGLDLKNNKEVDPYATLVSIEEIFGKRGKFKTTNTFWFKKRAPTLFKL